ncbi:MAG: hypothetical protein RJP96_02800 [Algiphilus sp.]|uniref:hypothetical protein n=1 Tax=Algiphilus sp. TaxID=1872431 RepID=UPI0032ED3D97
MTVRYYSYEDADAPQLDAQAGSLIALLDACLIDGYSSGGTEKPPLNWEIAFTGTDKRVYKSTSPDAFPSYLRVVDDGSSADGAESAQARAYRTMSDVDTGANATSEVLFKKTTGGSGRPWVLIGDERAFYLCVRISGYTQLHFYGDVVAQGAGDDGAVLLHGGGSGSSSSAWECFAMTESNGSSSEYQPNCYWLKDVDLIGDSGRVRHYSYNHFSNFGDDVLSHPNPVTGEILVAPIFVGGFDNSASTHYLRGRLPGGYERLTNYSAGVFEIIGGVNGLSDRDIVNLQHYNSSAESIFVDITGPWR